jgi:molybdate transport system permease protein
VKGRWSASWAGAAPLALFLVLPLAALFVSVGPTGVLGALSEPSARAAIWLSAKTTTVALAVIVLAGTPLAWRLARSSGRAARVLETLVELPIVIPPAVVGVALLQTYGRRGLLGPALEAIGVQVTFTTVAVIVAQIVVAAPFFVSGATAGFRRIDEEQMLVARTLGDTPFEAFRRVALPAALPSLVAAAALAWARALGEFGATLFFAGSMQGETQTMPLAVFAALESDVGEANALAVLLATAAFVALFVIRVLTRRGETR